MFFSLGGALARLVRVCHGFVHGYTMQKTQCLWALSRVSRVKHPQGIPTALNPLKSFVLQGLSNFAGFCRFLHITTPAKKSDPFFQWPPPSSVNSVSFSEIGAFMPTAWKSFSEGLARLSCHLIQNFSFCTLHLTAGLPWYTPHKIRNPESGNGT
jgi:hypothetical protein